MSRLRRFRPDIVALADEWSAHVESHKSWQFAGPVGAGESGSREVVRDDGLRAIAKPAFRDRVPRAAHERVAAELGRALCVPVPPVQLWRKNGDLFAVSAFPFRQPLSWAQAERMITPTIRRNLLPTLAAGYVFHAWIADTDHEGHPGNLLIDAQADDDEPAIAFIDHAFSMSFNWSEGAPPCAPLANYYAPPACLPGAAIAAMVQRIQSLGDSAIRSVVDAVPSDYFRPGTDQVITNCLIRRKRELPKAFGIGKEANP